MAMLDQFFDLAHPAAEMVPTAGPHAALDGLVTDETVADLDGCNIPRQTLRPIGFCRPFFRLSRLIWTHKSSHRFSFAICLKSVKEGRGGDHPLFAIGDQRRAGKLQSRGNAP
ncbi:hypothetical protein [Rhizobium changzhiense]|uniref:hypothetical protein n=1 Tax=Rhizobium changzhiense TaxID=2692317 RepID=UPI003145042A